MPAITIKSTETIFLGDIPVRIISCQHEPMQVTLHVSVPSGVIVRRVKGNGMSRQILPALDKYTSRDIKFDS